MCCLPSDTSDADDNDSDFADFLVVFDDAHALERHQPAVGVRVNDLGAGTRAQGIRVQAIDVRE